MEVSFSSTFPRFIQGHPLEPLSASQTNTTTMIDLIYVLTTIAFFGLMLAFIWACGKV
jgi:hypothetical protein